VAYSLLHLRVSRGVYFYAVNRRIVLKQFDRIISLVLWPGAKLGIVSFAFLYLCG